MPNPTSDTTSRTSNTAHQARILEEMKDMEIFASELLCLIRSSRSGYIDEPLVKINSDGRPPHLLFYAANDYSEIWKNVTHGYFALREQLQDLAIQEAKNNNNPSKLVAVDSQPSLTPSIPSSSTSLTCSCCTLHNKMMFPPTAKAMTMTTAASDSGEYGTETVVVTTTITTPKKTTGTKEHRATVKEQPNRGGGRGSLAGPMSLAFKWICAALLFLLGFTCGLALQDSLQEVDIPYNARFRG